MYSPERLIENLSGYLGELAELISAAAQADPAEKSRLFIEKSNIETYVGKLEALPGSHRLDAKHIEAGLALEPHPEGGFYREFIRTDACTVIFYLLPEQAISSWHSLKDTQERFRLISGESLLIPKIDAGGLWKSEEAVTYENDVVIEKKPGFRRLVRRLFERRVRARHLRMQRTVRICEIQNRRPGKLGCISRPESWSQNNHR